jgi:hypothetical protein
VLILASGWARADGEPYFISSLRGSARVRAGETVSDGFLHFLQRLFGLGGDRPKQAQPAPPSKKNRPSLAPKRKDKGSAKKKSLSDKPAKKEPPSRDKPAKKFAAKPKPGTRPKAPPSAAPTEASGEVPSRERPHGDRQKESPKEMAAPSVCAPATPEKPERKTEPGAMPASPPAGPAFDPKFVVLVSGNDIVILDRRLEARQRKARELGWIV